MKLATALLFVAFSVRSAAFAADIDIVTFRASVDISVCSADQTQCRVFLERDHDVRLTLENCAPGPGGQCSALWSYDRQVNGHAFRSEIEATKHYFAGKVQYMLSLAVGPVKDGNFLSSTTMRTYLGEDKLVRNPIYLDSPKLADGAGEWKAVLTLTSGDEHLIEKAAEYARQGGFEVEAFRSALSGADHFFQAAAKAAGKAEGSSLLFKAQDHLTGDFARMKAVERSAKANTFLAYLQLGIVGELLKRYGVADGEGRQGRDLVYDDSTNPAGEMTNEEACAIASSFPIFRDSLAHSGIDDEDARRVGDQMERLCRASGLGSCSTINVDRRACDGYNLASTRAAAVVGAVNAVW